MNFNQPILTSDNTQICKPHNGCVGIDDNWGIAESGEERNNLLGDIVKDSAEFNSFTDEMRYINRQFALSELLNDSTMLNTGSPDDYLYLQFVDSMKYTPIGYSEMVQKKIRSKQFDSAAYFNNLIVSERNMDENRKVVNEIYLHHFAEPDSVLASDDTTVLYNIAIQEPLLAGNAVYSARVMLGMDPDEEGFDSRSARYVTVLLDSDSVYNRILI